MAHDFEEMGVPMTVRDGDGVTTDSLRRDPAAFVAWAFPGMEITPWQSRALDKIVLDPKAPDVERPLGSSLWLSALIERTLDIMRERGLLPPEPDFTQLRHERFMIEDAP